MRIRTKLRNKVVRTDVIIRISLFTIFLWNIIFAAYLRAPVLNLFHDTEDAAASLEDGCDHGTTTRPYPGGTTSSSSALRSSSTAPGGVLVTDTGGAPLPIQEAHIITHDEEITRTASTTTTNGISRTTSMAGAPKHHHLVGSSSSSMTSTAISSSSWLQCSDYAIKLIHGLPLEDEEEDDRRRDGVNPIRSMSSSSTTFNGTTNADVLHDDDNTNTRTKCDINHKNNLLDFKNQQQQQVKNNTTSSTDEANDGGKNKKKVIDDDGTSPSLSLLPSKKNDNKVPCVCMILTTYNVVGYVSNAMEHILNQTHKHLEIIVVDDHSSDGTLELLLQKYGLGTAEKIGGTNRTTLAGTTTTTSSSSSNNPSITLQVVSLKQNTNGGTGQPSNIGMESCSSSSEYIMFADGDDYMELDTVETMVGLAKKFDAQVVVGNHDEIHQNDDGSTYLKPSGAFPKWETIPANKPFNVVTHPQILQTSPAPWRKLYQRSFLMDYKIQFPE
jgi:Glycosyltransferases involved in cell wall biogenesis